MDSDVNEECIPARNAPKSKFGARVYYYDDGVILIKQTVLKDKTYCIDHDETGQKEAYANPGDGQAARVLEILLDARRGELRRQVS